MIRRGLYKFLIVLLMLLGAIGCQRKKPIVVSSKPIPSQMLLAEIIAQHLENRLANVRIERRPGSGGTPLMYQAVAGGDITIYPETTGMIATGILREQPSPDPSVLLERDRLELARVAQLDLIELGFADGPAVVVPASAEENTISNAAQGTNRWKLGITPDFQQSADFLALNSYHLPQAAPFRTLEPPELFDGLAQGTLNMVVTTITDGHLATPMWKVLQDDKKAFASQQVCLIVRQERINDEPRLRPALGELSGKLTSDIVRKLNQELEMAHGDAAAVARGFLASAGLR